MSNSADGRPPIDGYIDPNIPNPNGEWDTPIIIYGYTPSIALAAFAACWFFILLIAHTARVVAIRSWWFVPFPVGLLFEVVGYIARSLSAKKDPYHLLYFILNYFFIVTAPVFLAAAVYTILLAMMTRIGRDYSLRPKLLLWFFIVSDIIATVTQVAGAALVGVAYSRRKDPTTPNNILLGGLAYQVFSMGTFVILSLVFLILARVSIREAGMSTFSVVFGIATIAIYLRTCFRLAETAQGLEGELQHNEVYFACLEFAPVALAALLYALWHPGRCVGSRVRQRSAAETVDEK